MAESLRTASTRILGGALPLLAALSLGSLVPLFVRFTQLRQPLVVGLAVSIGVAALLMGGFIVFRAAPRDWFNPLAFPVVYVGWALFLPIVFLLGVDRQIGNIQPTDVSLLLVVAFSLTVSGLFVGAKLGMVATSPSPPAVVALDYGWVRATGRLLLLVITVLRGSRVLISLGQPYGQGSVTYDPETFLKTLEDGLIFISVALIVVANAQLGRSILGRRDLVLLAAFALTTLASGSRGELVGPALFAVWTHHSFVRRIRLVKGFLLGIAVVLVFTLTFVYRSGRQIEFTDAGTFAEQALTAVSTPVFITSEVVARVPSTHPYMYGSTYVAAVKRQLPGPLSRLLWGDPDDTGTYVFRELIGFTSPDAGYAFALPSEAYLNFGFPGTFAVSTLAGLLFGYAYRKQASKPSKAIHLLYPILVATLPLSLRSDALVQVKGVLYPMLILSLVFWIGRRRFLDLGHGSRLNAEVAYRGQVSAGVGRASDS